MKTAEEILNEIKRLPHNERDRLLRLLWTQWQVGKVPKAASSDVAPDGRDWLEWASGLHKEVWYDSRGKLLDAQEYVNQERESWD